jgi:putative transposase
MLSVILHALITAAKSRRGLVLENIALRHQLIVLQRKTKKPRLKNWDRILWTLLSRIWSGWRQSLLVVQPETVVRWHRRGVRWYWRRKCRRPGRPKVALEVRELIRQMSRANPTWGAPRVHGELQRLGIKVGETTVAKYMVRHRNPPSQTWRTFLTNHMKEIVSVDFFTVPTVTFRVLFVFLILSNSRRRILHFNVTVSPTAFWTGQQIIEAFPWDTAPRFLIRDRDGIYGFEFTNRVESMGIEQVPTSVRSPWQKGYASHCTSFVGFERDLLRRIRRSFSVTPFHLYRTGASSPGGS